MAGLIGYLGHIRQPYFLVGHTWLLELEACLVYIVPLLFLAFTSKILGWELQLLLCLYSVQQRVPTWLRLIFCVIILKGNS